jgi:hypothetical protein
MAVLDLSVPLMQFLLGTDDITQYVLGFSARHPLAEIHSACIWEGTIELSAIASPPLSSDFFDNEINPHRFDEGALPISVYISGSLWQIFRIKPMGYRYDEVSRQATIEFTDILGILNTYSPPQDLPEIKVGVNNYWQDVVAACIRAVGVQLGYAPTIASSPAAFNGDYYQVPRILSSSFINEAQKIAGERGEWLWCDKEIIKRAVYPIYGGDPIYRKSRQEIVRYDRQNGLEKYVKRITCAGTAEILDRCTTVYPKYTYEYRQKAIGTSATQLVSGTTFVIPTVSALAKITKLEKVFSSDRRTVTYTRTVTGWWQFMLGGANLVFSSLTGIPDLYEFVILEIHTETKQFDSGMRLISKRTTRQKPLGSAAAVQEVLGKAVGYKVSRWKELYVENDEFISFAIGDGATAYTGTTIQNADQFNYRELRSIHEERFRTQFVKTRTVFTDSLGATSTSVSLKEFLNYKYEIVDTNFTKECLGQWRQQYIKQERIGVALNAAFGVTFQEEIVTSSIQEIEYNEPPYPVQQKNIRGMAEFSYPSFGNFVRSQDWVQPETLLNDAGCNFLAFLVGLFRYQRYFSRQIEHGYGSDILFYQPFQIVDVGKGRYVRDGFSFSINEAGEAGYEAIASYTGNLVGFIPEIPPPVEPLPPVLGVGLAIAQVRNQSFFLGYPVVVLLSAAGGVPPYSFSGVLPAGLSVVGNAIVGIPTAIGTGTYTVTVADAALSTASALFTIAVLALPVAQSPIAVAIETPSLLALRSEFFLFEGVEEAAPATRLAIAANYGELVSRMVILANHEIATRLAIASNYGELVSRMEIS